MTVTLQEAQQRLPELIAQLQPGEQLDVVQNGSLLATLTRSARTSWPCQAGSAKDKILWIAPDFDVPLEEFREYME